MAIKTYPLAETEASKTGFTHKSIISYADIVTAGGAATSAVIALLPYTAGTLFGAAAYRVVTAFDGGATSGMLLDVGHNGGTTDDPDSLLDAYEVHVDSTEILYGDGNGAVFATLRTGYAALDAGNIEATFTLTGGNANALTTGEVHVFLKVVDLTKY